MKPSTSTTQRSTLNAQRKNERGIALVIVLGVLTVILLIAVGFALSARTEARSGSNYHILVSTKTFTKLGMDRALMEQTYGLTSTPYSGRNGGGYAGADLTQLLGGNYTNDASAEFAGFQGDYIDSNEDGDRDVGEPYWIRINDASGKMIGRFAYLIQSADDGSGGSGSGSGSTKVDLNSIGNVRGAGDTYVRSNGFVGVYNATSPTNFTRGIAYDVNLEAFLEKLGYTSPTAAAKAMLQYRYGWPGLIVEPTPLNNYQPGDPSVDENGMGTGTDDPAEFKYNPDSGAGTSPNVDKSISDSTFAEVNNSIVADAAYTNLTTYATIASADDNKYNAYDVARINLNNTNISLMTDVSNVWQKLVAAYPTNDLVQLAQYAINIVDFHTTNLYPSTLTVGTTNVIGIKRTPYLNQMRQKIGPSVVVSGANAQIQLADGVFTRANYSYELWNPYAVAFNNSITILTTNTFYFDCNPPIAQLVPVTQIFTNTIASPIAVGITYNGLFPAMPALLSASFPTSSMPSTVVISNSFTFVTFSGTNVLARGYGYSSPTSAFVITNNLPTQAFFLNAEADDPRIGYLFAQTNNMNLPSASRYGLSLTNLNVSPTSPTPREGLTSFSTNMIGQSYASIADIGLVYAGEPAKGTNAVGAWQTLSLQPGGIGLVLDLLRVSEFTEVRGRINLNSDTNGPLGSYQSPALWALLKGINVPGYGVLSDTIVSNMVVGIADFRASLAVTNIFTNIGQICSITNFFTTDGTATGAWVPSTNDAGREYVIRSIADLITTRAEGGVEILAWGQVIKGNQSAGTLQIRAWPTTSGSRAAVEKFQYIRQ